MTPGSGAACLASLYSKVLYTGVAHNEQHEAWLRDLLKEMFVSMVISNDVVADADLVKKVSAYLKHSGKTARVVLPTSKVAFGDSISGEDDSDVDE
jgi:hypothetical protein